MRSVIPGKERQPQRQAQPPRLRHIGLVLSLVLGLVGIPLAAGAGGNGVVTFSGGGWGHGIGMSQYGAQGQALDGRDYETIVEHYYTGASLVDLATAVGSGHSPLLEYAEPLWLGVISNSGEATFTPRNGPLDVCQENGDCPLDPAPDADEDWVFKVVGPGECTFERDGVQVGSSGSCSADIVLDGAQVEFSAIGKTIGHGTMRIRPVGDPGTATAFHIAFSMELEDYIAGIAEVWSFWEEDTLKAQAVAARSFAAAKVHQRESGTRSAPDADPNLAGNWANVCGCHLRATTADQAYSGWEHSQIPSWSGAVSDTAGEVLTHPSVTYTYEGVVDAFYSSSTSGVTETNVGGFGSSSQFPYLVSVDDHWAVETQVGNPFASWEKDVTEPKILSALASTSRSWQVSFDWLTDVEHLQGPPEVWLRFTGVKNGSTQHVDVPGWWLRSAFGLRSPQITAVSGVFDPPRSGSTWHQDTGAIQSPVESGDRFGSAVASGDFDQDGRDDVAVGAPTDGVGATPGGGLVNVIYGSSSGLTAAGNQMFHQDMAGMTQVAEADDHFGAALAVGDFDDDGFDDLVIGVADEDIGTKANAGLIHILMGTVSGLDPERIVTQGTTGVPGIVEAGDAFGQSLAVGDFNDDGYDDLAVGAPGEAIGSSDQAGNVTILFGSAGGIDPASAIAIHQGTTGMDGSIETADAFGSALAAGDFDDDGHADLLVGSPGEQIGFVAAAGMIHVIPGSDSGLDPASSMSFHQDTPSVPGRAETGDAYGAVLTSGDLDGDGRDEAVIGVPDEAIGSDASAGMVAVVSFDGSLELTNAVNYTQNSTGIGGVVEAGDRFGSALATGDFFGDATDDLIIGSWGEAVGSLGQAGYIHIVPGAPGGMITALEISFTQGAMPSTGATESGDQFGWAIAAGDIDGDGTHDGIIGSPGEDIGTVASAGMIQTLEVG